MPASAPTLSLYNASTSDYDATPTVLINGLSVSTSTNVQAYLGNNCETLIASGSSGLSTQAILSLGITIPGTYTISAKSYNGFNWSSCSTSNVTYTLLSPPAPTSITLSGGLNSSDYDHTPAIIVSGVKRDHTITAYSDSSCTTSIASGVNPNTNDIYLTTTSLSTGAHQIYAKAVNEMGTESPCSTAFLSYTVLDVSPPTQLTLITPGAASDYLQTPTIRASGGLTDFSGIYLYRDSSCTIEAGSATVTSGNADIAVPILSAGSTYQFYAKAVISGNYSACSTATVSYQVLARAPFAPAQLYTTNHYSGEIKAADFNSDGKLDIITTGNQTASLSFFAGNGNGTIQSKSNISTPNIYTDDLKTADFNGDGKLDVVFGKSYGIGVMMGNGNGTFQTAVTYTINNTSYAEYVAIADLDGDSKLDLVVSSDTKISTLKGNGDGTFQSPVDYTASGAGWIGAADLNGDTFPDVVATSSGSKMSVYLNNGAGVLQPKVDYTTGSSPRYGAIADVNNDGKLDLVAAAGTYFSVQLGNGDGTFQAKTDFSSDLQGPNSIRVADIDNDGNLDVVAAHFSGSGFAMGAVSVSFGNGSGSFGNIQYLPTAIGDSLYGLEVADIDGDGDKDIVTAAWGTKLYVLKSLVVP